MTKKIAYGAAVLVGLLSLSGCAGLTQQSGPDPLPANVKPAKVIGAYQLPEGFRNVVEFCDNAGNSLAVTSRGADTAGGSNGGGLPSAGWLIRLDDPRCKA
jgi:hypothetical protein